MKPIKLKLKGINSFVNEENVDFERLTETGIFGIVGDTGSGKSTIIDAMILALYGEVPRYNKRSDREFINAYVNECFVSFEFQVNFNGSNQKFRIERNFKKKDNKIEEKISRFIRINGDCEEIVTSKIIEIRTKVIELLGLKYEDFTRAVILPQGKFSEFLTLENQDRRNMLERIFKLEKYGDKLNKKIKENYNNIENEMKTLSANLEANIDVTDEAIKVLRDKKNMITLALEKIENEEKSLKKTIDEQKGTLGLIEELENKVQLKNNLYTKKDNVDKKEESLNNSKKAESLIDYIKKIEEIDKDIEQLQLNKIKSEKEHNEAIQKEESIKLTYDKILNYKNENYEKLLENISNAKKALDEEKSFKEKTKELQQIRKEYKREFDSLKEEEKNIENLKNKNMDLTKKIDVTKIEKEKNKVTQDYRNIILKGAELEKELKNTTLEKSGLEKEIIEDKKNLEENKENLNKKLELEKELTRKYNKYSVDAKVINKLKESLSIGEICPLCGEIIKNNLVVDKESEEKVEEKQLEQLKDQILTITVNIKTLDANILKNDSLIKETKEKEKAYVESLTILKEKENIENFKEEYNSIELRAKVYENLEKELNFLEEELNVVNKNLEDLKTTFTVKTNNLKDKENIGKTLKALVDEISVRLISLVGENSPVVLLEKLELEKNKILEKESKAKINLEKTKEIVQTLKNKKEKLEGEISALIKINNSNKENLDEKMKLMNFNETNEIKLLFLGVATQLKLEEEIKKYKDSVLLVETKIKELEEKLKGIDVAKLKLNFEKETIQYQKITEEKNNSNKQLGSIKAELERLESKIKDVKKWTLDKKILTKDMDNLTTLKKLFAGNSFIEFIGKRHLKYICAEGTRRLKIMSNEKYEIQLDESDFVIKDNSRGGIIRSPKTLSGGEVFMVSLCLSLALSNQIQMKNSGSLDMFFLDEGFGTLDNNSRDMVINSLINLIDDNKMKIGLITHVEEIKEMLPSKLVVTINDPEEGSKAIIKR